jgi:hypothetical protein
MRGYRQAPGFMNQMADFERWPPLQIWQDGADTEKMSLRCGDFHSRDDQKTVHRQAIFTHQSLVDEVGDRVAGIVVGHDNCVEAPLTGGLDKLLRTADPVARKKRVAMEVYLHRHELQIIEEMQRAN